MQLHVNGLPELQMLKLVISDTVRYFEALSC